jgi:hypothetical protein
MGGSKRLFCSSVPNSMIGRATAMFVPKMMPVAAQASDTAAPMN